jgi:hypothetical protein
MKTPETLLLIRHGEKPVGEDSGVDQRVDSVDVFDAVSRAHPAAAHAHAASQDDRQTPSGSSATSAIHS